jgi:putative ABC transport system permease protein
MIKDYFRYALNSLRRRKLRSWLTMIGIFIGIAAVVSLIGLGQGLQYAISQQFGSLGTDKITVTASGGFGPPGTGVTTPLTEKNREDISRLDGVMRAAGRLVDTVRVDFNDRADFVYVTSWPPGDQQELVKEAIDLELTSGRLQKDSDIGTAVIGADLAKDSNAFERPLEVGSKIEINGQRFTVIGVMKKKGSFIFDKIIFIVDKEYRSLVERDDESLDIIVAQINEGADINRVKEDIERYLRRERDVKKGEEDFSVQTPQATLEQVQSTLFAVNLFVYIIAGISILVGGIGIMNTMYTAVLERTREIGIMKAIGAKNSTIFSLFFVESGLIGAVGGIIGAAIGVTLSYGMAAIGRAQLGSELIAAQISPWLVFWAVLGSFIIGSLFGILPAMRATKLHPVEALRHGK